MPRGPSTLYDAYDVKKRVTVKRMRISDETMRNARNGEPNAMKCVAMAFRRRVEKDRGFDPGWIEFGKLDFKRLKELF